MGLFIMDIGVTKGEKDLPRVEYIEGNEQLLDEVHILWEELIQDHRVKSKHFTSLSSKFLLSYLASARVRIFN